MIFVLIKFMFCLCRSLILLLLFQALPLQAFAASGYYLCTPPERLIDRELSITVSPTNYTALGVTDLVLGRAPERRAHYALNFSSYPPQMEAHDSRALFQSGSRVYRHREMEFYRGTNGTHSRLEVYRTKTRSPWNIVSASDREIGDHLLPPPFKRVALVVW